MTDNYDLALVDGKWILFSEQQPFLVFDTEAAARRAKHAIDCYLAEEAAHNLRALASELKRGRVGPASFHSRTTGGRRGGDPSSR